MDIMYILTFITIFGTLILAPVTINAATGDDFDSICEHFGSYYNCSGHGLSEIPSNVPSQLQTLKLNRNSLTNIPYFTSNVENLTCLSMGHNKVKSISRTALKKLVNLEILELNNNIIEIIRTDDLKSSPKLKSLILNHNEISEIGNDSFSALESLEELKLARNRISDLTSPMLTGLTSLKTLDLTKNLLKSISGLVFQGLKSMTILKLKQNLIQELGDGAFYGLHNLTELDLDENELSTISGGWLYGLELLQILNVSHNEIHTINCDWTFASYVNLIDLSFNRLESISKNSLKNLNNLKFLNLSKNHISFIEEDAFSNLLNLLTLDLSGNQLTMIIERSQGSYWSLPNLNELLLSNNKLLHIYKNDFAGLPDLLILDLADNNIASIDDGALDKLRSLKQFHMNSTSVVCDCSLSGYVRWLWRSTHVSLHIHGSSCAYPDGQKNKSISSLKQKELVCRASDRPQPRITVQPVDTKALVGQNVTIKCKANSSAYSDMNFAWFMNDRRLENGLNAIIQKKEAIQTPGVSVWSEVILNSVNIKDSGSYHCRAMNQYGVVNSRVAKLAILVFPVFTKTPENVVTKIGAAAKLECSGDGQPSPRISWKKDGGSNFPAAAERRMKMMIGVPNEPFYIVNTKLEDAGIYTCTATNDAGTINASATLVIHEPPLITKRMRNQQVLQGESVVMQCFGYAFPKPTVTWTKNGEPLPINPNCKGKCRHFLAFEDQLLIITETVIEDAGSYACLQTNTAGTKKNYATLQVVKEHPLAVSDDRMAFTNSLFLLTTAVTITITSVVWYMLIVIHNKKMRRKRRKEQKMYQKYGIESGGQQHQCLCSVDCNSSTAVNILQQKQHLQQQHEECMAPIPRSKDSGTGNSTSTNSPKRSYQDLLLTTVANHHDSMSSDDSDTTPSSPAHDHDATTLPLLSTFHPLSSNSNSAAITAATDINNMSESTNGIGSNATTSNDVSLCSSASKSSSASFNNGGGSTLNRHRPSSQQQLQVALHHHCPSTHASQMSPSLTTAVNYNDSSSIGATAAIAPSPSTMLQHQRHMVQQQLQQLQQLHHQQQQLQHQNQFYAPPHPSQIMEYCASPASSGDAGSAVGGVQCACLAASFKKAANDVCECVVNAGDESSSTYPGIPTSMPSMSSIPDFNKISECYRRVVDKQMQFGSSSNNSNQSGSSGYGGGIPSIPNMPNMPNLPYNSSSSMPNFGGNNAIPSMPNLGGNNGFSPNIPYLGSGGGNNSGSSSSNIPDFNVSNLGGGNMGNLDMSNFSEAQNNEYRKCLEGNLNNNSGGNSGGIPNMGQYFNGTMPTVPTNFNTSSYNIPVQIPSFGGQ